MILSVSLIKVQLELKEADNELPIPETGINDIYSKISLEPPCSGEVTETIKIINIHSKKNRNLFENGSKQTTSVLDLFSSLSRQSIRRNVIIISSSTGE
ncbi:hypothetical protein CEXT_158841 [Caerostris extrusa]|uniref:Uncharacterized protein n=1 Tax=Caerostris extrusa TaxID=172846 RepID=A0AAV4XK49_CAEEX|nr:hypothetical protein CEXT_158841 [Caerostris extrusa]